MRGRGDTRNKPPPRPCDSPSAGFFTRGPNSTSAVKSPKKGVLGWNRAPSKKEKEKPIFTPRPINAYRTQHRQSILLGNDSMENFSPLPPRNQSEPQKPQNRIAELAPSMASSSRRDQAKSVFWNDAQNWRKSVLEFVPPHASRARCLITRPKPPTVPPPRGAVLVPPIGDSGFFGSSDGAIEFSLRDEPDFGDSTIQDFTGAGQFDDPDNDSGDDEFRRGLEEDVDFGTLGRTGYDPQVLDEFAGEYPPQGPRSARGQPKHSLTELYYDEKDFSSDDEEKKRDLADMLLESMGDLDLTEIDVSGFIEDVSATAFGDFQTLGGLKNMALDLNFEDYNESYETQSSDDYEGDANRNSSSSQSEPDEIEVGPGVEVILKYKLGKGATAIVWCGMVDANIVAIKQISLKTFKDGVDSAKPIVKREFDIIRRINHPSIVKYYGLFYDKAAEEVNIVMELITGVVATDLVMYLSQVPEEIASFILDGILKSIVHLHTVCHVIHRDIKPDNVLIDVHGHIKVIDFGTATYFEPSKECKRRSTVGTPWYCAPEVINDEEYSWSCDIWSLGCFALELVSGKPPFDDLNDIQCLFKMAEGIPPPFPFQLSEECSNFLSLCLEKPRKRPNAMKLSQHPYITQARQTRGQQRENIRGIIKEMLTFKRKENEKKRNHQPKQLNEDRLTFNFG